MNRRFAAFAAALFILFAIPVQALAASGSTTVYITKSGTKYHTSTCSYLSQSKIPITLSDAVNNGYSPCSRCKPPTLSASSAPAERSYSHRDNDDDEYQISGSKQQKKSSDNGGISVLSVGAGAAALLGGGYCLGRKKR